MKQKHDNINIYLNSFEYFQKLEKSLATKLGLAELKSGIQVIRDNNSWRENEKSIKHVWIVTIARSFVGWGGLFAIKFNENRFREHSNPDKLVQGIFISNPDGVGQIYIDQKMELTCDVTNFNFNLFNANNGITLDGVNYNIRIVASNIDTFIQVNNPNTEEWKKWETQMLTMGKNIARESKDEEMINLFEWKI